IPDRVDQAVGADLADAGGLGDVVVAAVDGDQALGRLEAHAVGGGLNIGYREGIRLLHRVLPQVHRGVGGFHRVGGGLVGAEGGLVGVDEGLVLRGVDGLVVIPGSEL